MVQLAVVLDILKRSWQWLIALAVVGGLYLAAAAVSKVWLFRDLVVVAVVLGVGTVAVAKARPIIKRTRERLSEYPKLEAEVKLLRGQLSDARREAADEKERADEERLVGIQQGREQAIGVTIAHLYDVPELKAVVKRDGRLYLLAMTQKPARSLEGALYLVKSTLANEVKGVVRVCGPGGINNSVLVECVDQWVVSFWEYLRDNAEINVELPEDIKLARGTMDQIMNKSPTVESRPNIRGVA